MQWWHIALIACTALLAVTALVFLTAYITYLITFYSKRNKKRDLYLEKVAESYSSYGEGFEYLVKKLSERSSESVSVLSEDGLRLSAEYYHINDGAPLHILFHGYRSRASFDMSGAAYECMELGHNVLLVDQRAHGKSEGKTISFGINERKDLLLWCEYAKEKFGDEVPVFIWGLSMGAATVLMSLDLPLPENVMGAIADCPYSEPKQIINRVGRKMHIPMKIMFPFLKLGARVFGGFKLESESALKSVITAKIPVLLIHGEADNYVPCEMSTNVASAAKEAGVDMRFFTFPDAPHGASYLVDSERYRKIAHEFINEILERKKENVSD